MQSFTCCVITMPTQPSKLILSLFLPHFKKSVVLENAFIQQQPKKNKKQLKKLICSFLSSQGYCSPAFSQPLGAGHPQRLSHVRQYGLDRPVAPRCRRSHGGFARGSAGLWTGEKHTWGWCTERTGNLEQTQIKNKETAAAGHGSMSIFSSSCAVWKFCTQLILNRHIFCQTVLKRHPNTSSSPN